MLTLEFFSFPQYDEYKKPMENIGLQDSLLSRFDLLFILLDKNDRDLDSQIADHVVRMHRYRAPNEEDGERKSSEKISIMYCVLPFFLTIPQPSQ